MERLNTPAATQEISAALTIDQISQLTFRDLHQMDAAAKAGIPIGMQYLVMLGHAEYIGRRMQTGYAIQNDRGVDEPIPLERFHELCEEHVAPIMAAIEAAGPDHPDAAKRITVARIFFQRFLSEAEAE